ncbi:hypothetical protein B7486_06500 [cyanobacterium TDX16]|nr:hypothetical protein B7486_06500 [cyanobacterium TDX16]
MTVTIPDEILKITGLTERGIVIELACRLFEAGKLPLWPAAKLAGLERAAFEDECLDRGIPIYNVTSDDVTRDLKNLDSLGA